MAEKRITVTIDGSIEEVAREFAVEISKQMNMLQKPQSEHKPEYCSVEVIATRTGVCTQTVRNWIRKQKVKKVQIGRRVLIDFSEIKRH